MNLELWDEWKDTDAVRLAIWFLDAVMSEFIEKTRDSAFLRQANRFAERHRALGLGVLGWHSLLQKNLVPFESMEAKNLTTQIFRHIHEQAQQASLELAATYGCAPIFDECETYDGPKYRNTTVTAIAPTTSSSSILGQVSPGIEPYSSNYYKAGLAKGNFIRKNRYLEALLAEKGRNTEDVWRNIMLNQGSVQHLDFLSDREKEVFKTFKEISQHEIILQASIRQKFIDQGQSLNINIPPGLSVKEVNALLIEAWRLGVKGLYYQRSQSISKELLSNIVSCRSCEAKFCPSLRAESSALPTKPRKSHRFSGFVVGCPPGAGVCAERVGETKNASRRLCRRRSHCVVLCVVRCQLFRMCRISCPRSKRRDTCREANFCFAQLGFSRRTTKPPRDTIRCVR